MQSVLRVAFLLLSAEAFLVTAVQTEQEQRRLVRSNVAMSVSAGGQTERAAYAPEKSDAIWAQVRGQELLQEVQEMARSGAAVDPDKINIIKSLVNDELVPDLKATHETSVKQIAVNLEAIKTCNNGGDSSLNEIKSGTQVTVEQRRTEHATCREEEKDKHATQEQACTELDEFLNKVVVPANMPEGKPRDPMVDYVQTMSTYFCPKGPTVTELDEKCKAAEEANRKHKEECDRDQASFESGFCVWRTELLNTCDTLKGCYDATVAIYNTFVSDTKELVKKWKVEWSALQKILCYTDVWLSEKTADMAAQYDSCNGAQVDTSPMDVEYPAVPAKLDCVTTAVATYPGGGGFANAEYSEFSDFANTVIPCVSHQ